MKTWLLRGFVASLVFSLAFSPLSLKAAEAPPAEEAQLKPAEASVGEELGYGVGSVLASLFYSPVKVTYAGLGLLTGGLGFILSGGNTEVANNIINPAVRGNYVVTPRHLKGEEALIFIGPSSSPPPQEASPPTAPQP